MQVLSVCSLAPILMNSSDSALPEMTTDFGALLVGTANSVIQHVQRSSPPLPRHVKVSVYIRRPSKALVIGCLTQQAAAPLQKRQTNLQS